MSPITHVIKRDGSKVPYTKTRIANAIYRAAVSVGGRDKNTPDDLADQVTDLLNQTFGSERDPAVEDIQDIVEKVLIENGHAKVAKAYILYRAEQQMRHRVKLHDRATHTGNIPYQKIWETYVWAVDHHVNTIHQLNERISKGEFPDIVRESDRAYEEDIHTAGEIIAERRDVRIVIVAGPSSSGKTTTTTKLAEYLQTKGLGLVELNVDNYFYDLELHPKDEFGDHDFDTPHALDLQLINEHIRRMLDGEQILTPYYDFKSGKRYLDRTPMRVAKNEIILIDSLHGLYGAMTAGIAPEAIFKVYIETLLQMKGPNNKFIRWTDLRLMRRMVRDSMHRGYAPEQTLTHWHYVRSAELQHIIPAVNSADYVVNGAVPYELPIMRPRLLEYFREWEKKYADDPRRADAYVRAKRVRELLEMVTPVEDESSIPATSHIREFIGGLAYDVH
ncbi:MAG: response regulator SirA [Candidatus Marinimicrobia bacterium CG_4_10_14_0_2_um_filter_48_9]|nr:MAG: response regulator SirA [Candidatus Marinimicrobia bacterium CG_4_10_14_0_2_um_filter_48_9]